MLAYLGEYARPGKIKEVISVGEGHPRSPDFMTSDKFNRLRNELYSMLRDEIRKAVEGEDGRAVNTSGS